MAKISFITLGCKLNYAETSTYERALSARGLEVVDWREKADLCLVNTCSVTEHSDHKCRNVIKKVARQNPDCKIIVTGCYAALKPEEISAIDGVVGVFKASEKIRVVDFILELAFGEAGAEKAGAEAFKSIFPAYSTGERTRSFLKVQDGCDNYCTYCTVPFARGHSRSITICEAVRQASEIAAHGVKEIVLTGVNTGDFGKHPSNIDSVLGPGTADECEHTESFLDLLKALNEVEGIERYRISSIEPNLITDEIVDWIASGSKILPHFHIPLQSGSDEILRQMDRHYDTAFFEKKIEYIRSKIGGHVFFGIDVIVGFPGETDELFRETYDFLCRIRPAFIHIFPYSRRKGTVADARKDQVQDIIKTYRVAKLEELCKELHSEFIRENALRSCDVLFEGRSRDGMMRGYTDNYLLHEAPYESSLIGKIVRIDRLNCPGTDSENLE